MTTTLPDVVREHEVVHKSRVEGTCRVHEPDGTHGEDIGQPVVSAKIGVRSGCITSDVIICANLTTEGDHSGRDFLNMAMIQDKCAAAARAWC
jgi:hypothetical protein